MKYNTLLTLIILNYIICIGIMVFIFFYYSSPFTATPITQSQTQTEIQTLPPPTTLPPTQTQIQTQPPTQRPTQRPPPPKTDTPKLPIQDQNTDSGGGAAFVSAINSAFGLSIGHNASQDSCVASHARAEPTLAQAHAVWKTGNRCPSQNGQGKGAVWAGTPDPTVAARLWLNSPPHASIIRSASQLACGAGPSSAVCISY